MSGSCWQFPCVGFSLAFARVSSSFCRLSALDWRLPVYRALTDSFMCRLSLDACSCFELFLLAACRFELSFARVLALFGIYRISCSFFGCRVSALVKSFARMSSSFFHMPCFSYCAWLNFSMLRLLFARVL